MYYFPSLKTQIAGTFKLQIWGVVVPQFKFELRVLLWIVIREVICCDCCSLGTKPWTGNFKDAMGLEGPRYVHFGFAL